MLQASRILLVSILMMGQQLFAIGEKPYDANPYPPHLGPPPSHESFVKTQRKLLSKSNFELWSFSNGQCMGCELYVLPTDAMLESEPVYRFIRKLETEKAALTELYEGSSEQEYIFLSHLAIGILGRESLFFGARRYWLKENFQPGVNFLKFLQRQLGFSNRASYRNSRGPTQIKDIPEIIATRYKVTPDNLFVPENAAVATMGYLIEALKELKIMAKANQLAHIHRETFADYLPYIYFGSRKALINNTATPEKNIYIKDMKRYMNMVEIHVKN